MISLRHCEPKAKQSRCPRQLKCAWIASSLTLLAMTEEGEERA